MFTVRKRTTLLFLQEVNLDGQVKITLILPHIQQLNPKFLIHRWHQKDSHLSSHLLPDQDSLGEDLVQVHLKIRPTLYCYLRHQELQGVVCHLAFQIMLIHDTRWCVVQQ